MHKGWSIGSTDFVIYYFNMWEQCICFAAKFNIRMYSDGNVYAFVSLQSIGEHTAKCLNFFKCPKLWSAIYNNFTLSKQTSGQTLSYIPFPYQNMGHFTVHNSKFESVDTVDWCLIHLVHTNTAGPYNHKSSGSFFTCHFFQYIVGWEWTSRTVLHLQWNSFFI